MYLRRTPNPCSLQYSPRFLGGNSLLRPAHRLRISSKFVSSKDIPRVKSSQAHRLPLSSRKSSRICATSCLLSPFLFIEGADQCETDSPSWSIVRASSISSVHGGSGVEAIEQKIDDHAGDGDVQPDGQSPAGDAAMAIEFLRQGARERDQGQRHDDDGQHGVRAEQREVYGTNPALPLEMHNAGPQMIDHVGSEKNHRARKRNEHAGAMRRDAPAADLHIARREKNGAGGIQDRVQCGCGDHWRRREPTSLPPAGRRPVPPLAALPERREPQPVWARAVQRTFCGAAESSLVPWR